MRASILVLVHIGRNVTAMQKYHYQVVAIGSRPVDQHLKARLEALGAKLKLKMDMWMPIVDGRLKGGCFLIWWP